MLNKLKIILSLETVFAFRNTSCTLSTTSRSPEDNYELVGGQVREFQALGTTLGRGELGRHTSQWLRMQPLLEWPWVSDLPLLPAGHKILEELLYVPLLLNCKIKRILIFTFYWVCQDKRLNIQSVWNTS